MEKISIIVPLYNEEQVIDEFCSRVNQVADTIESRWGIDSEIILINDGSSDNTLTFAKLLAGDNSRLKIISLSRNFGHQSGVTAGLDHATGSAAVIIDADLQDPPELILDMITKWKDGFQVIYGKRKERKGESIFKKLTAKLFYRMLNSISEIDIPNDTGDFRLIDRVVIDALKSMPERNRYIRGLVSWSGFKQSAIEYSRDERYAGSTKYSLNKMIKFALNGVTSFSSAPLIVAMYMGFIITAISSIFILWILYTKLFTDQAIQGWASQLTAIVLFGGVQLISTGVIGLYISRVLDEVKQRPQYIICEKVNF